MKKFVNIITTIRFVYTLFLPILKAKVSKVAFFINIVILFLTDSIDGILARKFKVQSLYGALMDTVADKALCIVLLMLLTKNIEIIFVLIIFELIIALINTIAMIKGKKTKSIIVGKIKMCVLSVNIILNYLYLFGILDKNLAIISAYITIFIQLMTVINYLVYVFKSEKTQGKTIFQVRNMQDLKYVLFDTEYYLNTL